MARHGARGWALCGLCVALLAGEAPPAAPPVGKARQVKIEVLVAKAHFEDGPTVRYLEGNPSVRHVEGHRFYGGKLEPKEAARFARRLQEMQQKRRGEIISLPCLITTSGRVGSVMVGQSLPVEVWGADGKCTIQQEDFGTRVTALPNVLADGTIHVELEVEVSSWVLGVTAVRRTHTTVELKSGRTFVQGGLVGFEKTVSDHLLQTLSQLPAVGPWFTGMGTEGRRYELVISCTATIR